MTLSESTRKQAADIFTDPVTLASTAIGLGLQLFDEECLDWNPEMLETAIREQLRVIPHPDVMQRFQAMSVVMADDRFFTVPEIFHIVTASLLDPDSEPEQMRESPAPVEMAWSVTEVAYILGSVYKESLYSDNVRRYCGAALMSEGLYLAPKMLRFAEFPSERYPDILSADEVFALSFNEDQQTAVKAIESSVQLLERMYRQQLSRLAVFGGNKEAFEKLGQIRS